MQKVETLILDVSTQQLSALGPLPSLPNVRCIRKWGDRVFYPNTLKNISLMPNLQEVTHLCTYDGNIQFLHNITIIEHWTNQPPDEVLSKVDSSFTKLEHLCLVSTTRYTQKTMRKNFQRLVDNLPKLEILEVKAKQFKDDNVEDYWLELSQVKSKNPKFRIILTYNPEYFEV